MKLSIKNYHINYLFLFLIVVSSFSCKEFKLKQDIKKLKSREIKVSTDKMICQINGKDTTFNNFYNNKMKMVVYYDSLVCSPCSAKKIRLWNNEIDSMKVLNPDFKYYFIFAPKKEDENTLFSTFMEYKFNYPVFIDVNNVFRKENPHLPDNLSLHTFLLDKNNKVVLVGNPIHNTKIKEMYNDVVKKYLKKE